MYLPKDGSERKDGVVKKHGVSQVQSDMILMFYNIL